MIGKQIKGKSFRGLLNYLHHKERAQLIGGNMAGHTPRVLAAEFGVSRDLNPRLQKAVYHASLSLPKPEQLNNERWCELAADYLTGMGFRDSQYVIYRHSDRDHDHIHIVASRIRLTDGSTVSDSWDYRRSETLIRSLETQYDLTPVTDSRTRDDRAPTTGEMRRQWRTGEAGARSPLVSHIEQAAQGAPTLPQFMHRLKDTGINVRLGYTRTGKVKGISYDLDGIAFSGSKLGKAYTFPGLQNYREIIYRPEMRSEIVAANQRPPATHAEQSAQQQQRTEQVAPILADFLTYLGQREFEGRQYHLQGDATSLVLTRLSDGEPLLTATWDAGQQRWRQQAPSQLSDWDLENISALAQRLHQARQHQQRARQRHPKSPDLEL